MILIIDDDPSVTASLALLLKQAGYQSRSASSPAEALELLESEEFRLLLQDMNFSRRTSGEEGLELLRQVKRRRPELPVVLMTAWGSIQLAVEGIRAGASDFITKPWTHQQLLQAVETALGLAAAQAGRQPEQAPSRADLDARFDFKDLVGVDARFVKTLDLIGRICATDASVLITGESGTGKELVAAAVHHNSHRRGAPFVKVNLGGISASLFESEMFGHVKGAFTDARSDRKGRFELADGGTIFLDEVGDLDLHSQVKLLRVLQDRTYEVLGSSLTRSVNVRVIAATNRNLAEMVASGAFREDLLYRLNLITIHLPALRERAGDIPLLAQHFLNGLAKVYRRAGLRISPAALGWLQGWQWPGNVRQLRQLIERTVLVTDREVLGVDDFRQAMAMESEPQPAARPQLVTMKMDEVEKETIQKSLARYDGNISKAAEALGFSRAALYRRMEKYGIKAQN